MSAQQRARAGLVTTIVTLGILGFSLLMPVQANGMIDKSPIYVGQIVPRTGVDSTPQGPLLYFLAGGQLALRQINKHGGIHGRPIRLIVADDQSGQEGAIAAFHYLVGTRHVSAIVMGGGKGVLALPPYIKKARIPTMIGGTVRPQTDLGNPWIFHTRPKFAYLARALATFAVNTLHVTKVAIIHTDDPSGTGGGTLLLADLKAVGVEPVTNQSFSTLSPDLTAQVLAIKRSGATALISDLINVNDYIQLARQMQQVGLHLTWLGDGNLGLRDTRRGGGALLYGTYAATDYAPGQSAEALSLEKASKAAFHLPGGEASANTYDGLQILAKVMRKVGTGPQAIRRGVLAIRGYRGTMGTYNFDRNGESLRQATIVKNISGGLRVVKVLSFK